MQWYSQGAEKESAEDAQGGKQNKALETDSVRRFKE